MAAGDITTGIGLRMVYVAVKDVDGTILVPTGVTVGVATRGTKAEGAQALSVDIPDPRQVNVRGDDITFYTWSLPPEDQPTGELRVAKWQLPLMAEVSDVKVFGAVGQPTLAMATNEQGEEPPMYLVGSRRAVNVAEGDAAFGTTYWQTYILPNATLVVKPGPAEDGNPTEVRFMAVCNKATVDPLGIPLTAATNGCTSASIFLLVTANKPMICAFLGDATETAFVMPNTIVTGSARVAVDGVLKTITTDYTVAGATVTFVAAPALGAKIMILAEYTD